MICSGSCKAWAVSVFVRLDSFRFYLFSRKYCGRIALDVSEKGRKNVDLGIFPIIIKTKKENRMKKKILAMAMVLTLAAAAV